MKALSPAKKGLITGTSMILVYLFSSYVLHSIDSKFQYLIYLLLTGGIIWTLNEFVTSPKNTWKFGPFFSEGFKCFIVVTFLMVAYTFLFLHFNPQYALDYGTDYRAYLIKSGDKTPAEIEKLVKQGIESYPLINTSMTIFKYLFLGALITAATAAFYIVRRQSALNNQSS